MDASCRRSPAAALALPIQRARWRAWLGWFVALTALATLPISAQSRVSVTLAWDADPASGAVGYNVYYGTSSRAYTQIVSVANTNQATITNLFTGTTYFIAVTAVDATGLESGYSDEIAFTPAPNLPTIQPGPAPPGQFLIKGSAAAGHIYDVLASQDLKSWTAIGTVTAGVDGSFTFIDTAAGRYPSRFYRLYETTNTPVGTLPNIRIVAGAGGATSLQVMGQFGHVYDILASQDLHVWMAIGTVTVGANGSTSFGDPMGSRYPCRFYRLHEVTYTPEGSLPVLQVMPLSGGQTLLSITGQVGHRYDVLATQDFLQWTLLGTVLAGGGGWTTFIDQPTTPRSYRLRESVGRR